MIQKLEYRGVEYFFRDEDIMIHAAQRMLSDLTLLMCAESAYTENECLKNRYIEHALATVLYSDHGIKVTSREDFDKLLELKNLLSKI